MRGFFLFVCFFLTTSFSYNKPKFEIGAFQGHDWRTDYNAYRSFKEIHSFQVVSTTHVEIEELEFDVEYGKEAVAILSGEKSFLLNNQEVRIRDRGSEEGKRLAREYLKQEYLKLNYDVSIQGNNVDVRNFVAERKGEITDKFIILTSHLDSVWNKGADDNASGTVSNLLIAKAIKDKSLKYSLRIIAFDVEELGLVGSKQYTRGLNKSTVLFNWNQDMVGFDSDKDRAFHIMDCDREDSIPITTRALYVLQELNLPLKVTKACTDRSDHAAFWRVEIPAVITSENFFGKDGNTCYHESCDRMNLIDWDYMMLITKLTGTSLLTFLQGY